MKEATAVAFRELGFRVIEGGKSGKLAILKTIALPEMFPVRHDNVLRDLRQGREKLPSNLRRAFDEHCRPAKYRARDNTERDCFELTKVGFLTSAIKYDDALRLLLALAFDALEQDDDAAGATAVSQINARIRELRSRASGQEELVLPLLTHEQPEPDVLPEPTACDLTHVAKANNDNAQARLDFGEGDKVLDELTTPVHQYGVDPEEGERWTDQHEGVDYTLILRPADNCPLQISMMRADDPAGLVLPQELFVQTGQGERLLLNIDPGVPYAVVRRAYERLPRGPFTARVLETIKYHCDD